MAPAIDTSGSARNAAGATIADKNSDVPSHAASTSAAGRGRLARNLCSAGVVVCCAVGQFVAVQRIDRLCARLAAPIESLAPTDPARLTFDRLHSLSVGALGVAMLLALASIVLLWRAGLASTVSPE